MSTILEVDNLAKHFDISGGFLNQLRWKNGKISREHSIVRALNNVSFSVKKNETLSLVGESGCGKSTLARVVIGLYPPTQGRVFYCGKEISSLSKKEMLSFRSKIQMVFQDPCASLNPRMKVGSILKEPLCFHRPDLNQKEVSEHLAQVMDQVGLDPKMKGRFPHEFSGGQRQRINIARALMVSPEFLIADEPVSALDVSIQAQVLNLFMELQEKRGLSYLFITHDLSVVEHISDRVMVMYLGSICELAPKKKIFSTPRHPYTQALLSAAPQIGKPAQNYVKLEGDIPTPLHLPSGCYFHSRCKYANQRCQKEAPKLLTIDDTQVACHGVEEGRI